MKMMFFLLLQEMHASVPKPLGRGKFSKCQLSDLIPEGKHAIKGQVHSKPFTLWEAGSFVFSANGQDAT